jgi:hypothetical protein
MKLFVCIFSDARLLPHFLSHYAGFGVSEFHIAAPPWLADETVRRSTGHAVTLYTAFDVDDSVTGGTLAVSGMRSAAQEQDEWVVIVDLDEFVEFDGPVAGLLPRVEAEQANVVRGVMVDRFALDGQPTAVRADLSIDRQYPVGAPFIQRVMNGADYKGVLVKGRLPAKVAHHIFEGERVYSHQLEISHYKWTESALERVQRAHEMAGAHELPWAGQYKSILDHYERHGRFAWETFGGKIVANPDLSA